MNAVERKLVAAAFSALDRGSRAAAAVAGAFPDKVGNTAVLQVDANDKVKFVESKDWGAGRGALVGAAVGVIGGPPGMLLGGGIGALAAKLRDSGFNDEELARLGESLVTNSSAVVIELAGDAVETARKILEALAAEVVVVEPVDSSVAEIFDSERPPAPEEVEAAPPTAAKA